MPRVGLEPTIPVFERAETVHALDRAATVIDQDTLEPIEFSVVSLNSLMYIYRNS
jgi:hypothetical protein